MASQRHKIHVGDTLTPVAKQLKQKGENGVLGAVNLTGLTVKFSLVSEAGVKVVDEATTGVTVTDAANGKVTYDFQAADVANAGTFTAYFHTYSGTERDTFPSEGDEFQVIIQAL